LNNIKGTSESKIGDLRPVNVFLSEKGKIKVANEFSWPGEFNALTKVLDGQSAYASP
jgi:hypothetical protein